MRKVLGFFDDLGNMRGSAAWSKEERTLRIEVEGKVVVLHSGEVTDLEQYLRETRCDAKLVGWYIPQSEIPVEGIRALVSYTLGTAGEREPGAYARQVKRWVDTLGE